MLDKWHSKSIQVISWHYFTSSLLASQTYLAWIPLKFPVQSHSLYCCQLNPLSRSYHWTRYLYPFWMLHNYPSLKSSPASFTRFLKSKLVIHRLYPFLTPQLLLFKAILLFHLSNCQNKDGKEPLQQLFFLIHRSSTFSWGGPLLFCLSFSIIQLKM